MTALLLLAAVGVRAESGSAPAVISEIMFNPDGNENAREFIEIFNRSGAPLSLEGWIIGDGEGFDPLVPAGEGGWIIAPGGFAVVVDPDYLTAGEPYDPITADTPLFTVPDQALGSRGLSNSVAEPVYLISAAGDTLSRVLYSIACPPGHSWERVRPYDGDDEGNFLPSLEKDGTPGGANSVTPPSRNPALTAASLRFASSSPLPGEPFGLLLSYRNDGLSPVSDVRVSVRMLPDVTVGTAVFPDTVLPGEDAPSVRLETPALPGGRLTFAAVIEGEAAGARDDTLILDLDVPVPAGTMVLNEIMAAPREGPEWVELLNTAGYPVSLRGWSLADLRGKPSSPSEDPRLVPGGGMAVLAAGPLEVPGAGGLMQVVLNGFPSLNNDGDTVWLFDAANIPMDSVSYTATPSGVSRELISPRLRGSATAWDLCTDSSGSTPGRRNSIYFSRVEDDAPSGGPVLTVSPNPFSDRTTISYDLPFPLSRVRMSVYDRRGRFIVSLRDTAESGSSWSGEWDGRKGGTELPAGPYLLFFEVLNKNTGEALTIRKTIVLARRL